MASIEYIQKRIEGKEKELDKPNKKLARIRKVEAQNWNDPNPYYYNERDLKWCLRDIADAQAALEKWQQALATETEKANSRNVQAILDFLEMWKQNVRDYYGKGLTAFYADKKTVRDAYNQISKFRYGTPEHIEAVKAHEALSEKFYIDRHGKFEYRMVYNRWMQREEKQKVKVKDGKYEYLAPYSNEATIEEATEKLEKDLVLEANRKYDYIIERTNRIVGQITDATNLHIGAKHDLNGYIIGTNGTAKVQTIGAGGYNIQCFHFRTLINELKG